MPRLHDYARSMRRDATPAEHKLWQALRSKQIGGHKWRRQVPIGRYIVDFYCSQLCLVIEVDGESHADPQVDELRDAWLKTQGLTVLRFWNNEVLGNFSGVLERIAVHPSPNPLPQGEGAFDADALATA